MGERAKLELQPMRSGKLNSAAQDERRSDIQAFAEVQSKFRSYPHSSGEMAADLDALIKRRSSKWIKAQVQLFVAQQFVRRSNKVERALAELALVRRYRVPDATATSHLQAANLCRYTGRREIAIRHYRSVISLRPDTPAAEMAARELVDLYCEMGKTTSATYAVLRHRRICRSLIKRFAGTGAALGAYLELTCSYARFEESRAARNCFEKFRALNQRIGSSLPVEILRHLAFRIQKLPLWIRRPGPDALNSEKPE